MKYWMAVVALVAACSSDNTPTQNDYRDTGVDIDLGVPDLDNPDVNVTTSRLFPTDANPGHRFEDCLYASPIRFESVDGTEIIAVAGESVVALDSETGAERWSVRLPAPEGERAMVFGTPGITNERFAVFAYYTTERNDDTNDGQKPRVRQLAAVVDLEGRRLADGFDFVELDGPFSSNEGGEVTFRATNALPRPEVVIAGETAQRLGYAYVTMGNARDIQPWHGFAFELNLDSWRAGAEPITGRLVTTPEEDCGQAGVSGSRDRICGGGLWAPSGPLVVERGESFDLILAPGNGQLDLARNDFANTLMRIEGRGLNFSPECDPQACANFDPDAPGTECVESCRNLFVPRMETPPKPESGRCEGLTMFECWQALDYIGGSTPVHIVLGSGTEVLAYPTKDGAVYLVDANNLGVLYDREQLVSICGTESDQCRWDWAGMIVTQPASTELNGAPLIIVPTFMPDQSHPAGIVALRINDDAAGPNLEVVWQAPNFSSTEAIQRFREHPTRPVIQRLENGVEIAWVGEALRSGPGKLVGVRTWDGKIIEDRQLHGPGNRFTVPLVVDDKIYVASCGTDRDSGYIEGYQIIQD